MGLKLLQAMHHLAPEALVGAVTYDDGTDTRSVLKEIRAFAKEKGIPLKVAKNGKEAEKHLLGLKPDVCLVSGWYWLISQETLDAVPGGLIGIHNSLLPKYRGFSPLVWAMINGERVVGITFYGVTEGMDDGPIYAQASVRVEQDDDINDVMLRLEDKVTEAMESSYLDLLDRRLRPRQQDHLQASYCAQRMPEDGLIDWTRPAECLWRFVRAQTSPYPGAFTYVEGQKMTVWKARYFGDVPYFGVPGQVARVTDEGVLVIAGDDRALWLEEVAVDGERGHPRQWIKTIKARLSPAPVGG